VSGERTENATPKRLQQMRGEGRVARSPEISTAVGLLAGCIIIQMTAGTAGSHLIELFTGSLSQLATTGATTDTDVLWGQRVVLLAAQTWLFCILPLIVALPLLGIGVTFAQGVVISFKPLFRVSNLNPATGIQRLFSMQSIMNLGKSLIKVTLVCLMTWRGLDETLRLLPTIDGSTDPRAVAAFLAQAMMNVALPAAEVMLGVAAADYAYQRWSFTRSARMSKQEVKEEHKQQEGDPHVKGQIRARQRKMALSRRQLLDVPKATVVVTNPTHIAVALQYERGMASPKVVAMGADLIAEQIKKIARQAGVPTVENVPLARGLFASVEVGQEIPVELYQAVAEVLAYVFSLRARRRQRLAS
jgi:flagellar biosynthesis protein FlhB